MTDRSDDLDDSLAWETTDAETMYSSQGFDVVCEAVRLPDGTETTFDSVREPGAVVVLAFTPSRKVVLIEEWRQAVGRTSRGLPAGTIEPGEDPASAARRELEEETGYLAGELGRLTVAEPLNGLANSVHHHFVARECRPEGERDLDENESIAVELADYDEVVSALAADEPLDGRSALCLLYYECFGGGER